MASEELAPGKIDRQSAWVNSAGVFATDIEAESPSVNMVERIFDLFIIFSLFNKRSGVSYTQKLECEENRFTPGEDSGAINCQAFATHSFLEKNSFCSLGRCQVLIAIDKKDRP
jgi:hypothetical protein